MQNTDLNVFNYTSARQFLLDGVAEAQKNRQMSVRALAREMGFASHTLLLMLIQGKRPLRVKHSLALAKGFGLSSQQRLFLQALIQFESAEDIEEKKLCQVWLSELHPLQQNYKSREVDELLFYSNWIHTAILAATYLETPLYSAKDVADIFPGHVTLTEAHAAIERLISLDLLKKNAEGRLEASYQKITSADDILNKGIQSYHKQTSSLAAAAIESLPLDQREFQSFSLPVRQDKIPLAKELIRKFRHQFSKTIGCENGQNIYQMNIQFFQLTESPAAKLEDEGVDTENKVEIPNV